MVCQKRSENLEVLDSSEFFLHEFDGKVLNLHFKNIHKTTIMNSSNDIFKYKQKVVFIARATNTYKTKLLIDLAIYFSIEIINLDLRVQ